MNYVAFNLFPGGRPKALTFSYDDGTCHDRRLVEIFNRYQMKGSFHLNSGNLTKPKESHVVADEVATLYAGHEVSAHCVHHPFLDHQPTGQILDEVREDCRVLEGLAGYPVRGMSYPYGAYSERVVEVLRTTEVRYSRTVQSTGQFKIPEDFLVWHPTCHHKGLQPELVKRFLEPGVGGLRKGMLLFYVWGHSYEFDRESNWDLIEKFCAEMSGLADVWYATNITIYDYVAALHRLEFSVDRSLVFNPTSQTLWFTANGGVVCVEPGATLRIG